MKVGHFPLNRKLKYKQIVTNINEQGIAADIHEWISIPKLFNVNQKIKNSEYEKWCCRWEKSKRERPDILYDGLESLLHVKLSESTEQDERDEEPDNERRSVSCGWDRRAELGQQSLRNKLAQSTSMSPWFLRARSRFCYSIIWWRLLI